VKASRLALFVAILLVQFGLFEAALRLASGSEAAPVFQQLFMQDAEMGGYRLKPGASAHFKTTDFETDIVINSSGTRGPEIPAKPAGEKRIAVIGDSLVLSVQVQYNQTFCALLEKRLNDHRTPAEPRYRVINAGVQGYGPVEELNFYERVVKPLQPDVVLVAVYVGNDAIEAFDSGSKILPAGASGATGAPADSSVRTSRGPSRWPLWLRRITRRSMVLQIVRLRATTLAERFGEARPIDRALTLYLPTAPPDIVRGLSVTRECLSRIAADAASRGARTGIVLLPARFQVASDDYANLDQIVRDSGYQMVRDAGTERFRQALEGIGVPIMDALPVLRGSTDRENVFFKTTAHLTPAGHQVMASALEQFLDGSGLLAPPAAPRGDPASTGGAK
jgi:lysophospholipase L1-like esterase